MINPRIKDDLVLIMISNQDSQANSIEQEKKETKDSSFLSQEFLCSSYKTR